MNMEKRALLAVLLSLVVWIGFNYFYGPPKVEDQALTPGETPAQEQPVAAPDQPVSVKPLDDGDLKLFSSQQADQSLLPETPEIGDSSNSVGRNEVTEALPGGLPEPAVSDQKTEPVEDIAPGKDIIVENDLYRAVFSSSNAALTSFQLKQHKEKVAAPAEDDEKGAKAPVSENHYRELIPPPESLAGLQPCLLKMQDSRLDEQLSVGAYSIDGPDHLVVTDKEQFHSIVFTKTLANGLGIQKRYDFTHDSYLINLTVRFLNASDQPLNAGSKIILGGDIMQESSSQTSRYGFVGPALFLDGRVEKINLKKVTELKNYVGNVSWMAIADLYFFLSLVPESGRVSQIELRPLALQNDDPKAPKPFEFSLWTGIRQLEPMSSASETLKLFFGPKEYERLEKAGFNLHRIVDLGTFAFLARPFLKAMNYFYDYLGNYGFSIILLTVLVRLAMAPITHYQMKSMRNMQKLQPEINKIKNKYKKEPQLANTEMMKLYKTHKVNPTSGCLPILVQIPVFFALYSVLAQAIELRGAPFILWITDLSDKDPYKITPILMGVSMYLQQRTTPSTIDPKQKQIMSLMPIFMTFLFLNFPSGLVLYWLVSNLLSLSYQGLSILYRKRSTALANVEK